MPGWSFSSAPTFSVKHLTAFLHLGLPDSTSAVWLRTMLNSNITSETQKYERYDTKYLTKKKPHLFTVWAEMKRQFIDLLNLNWDSNFSLFCTSPQIIMKTLWVLIWGLQIFASKQVHKYKIHEKMRFDSMVCCYSRGPTLIHVKKPRLLC